MRDPPFPSRKKQRCRSGLCLMHDPLTENVRCSSLELVNECRVLIVELSLVSRLSGHDAY